MRSCQAMIGVPSTARRLVHFSTAAGDGCGGATIEARSRADDQQTGSAPARCACGARHALDHAVLHLDGAADRIYNASELDDASVALAISQLSLAGRLAGGVEHRNPLDKTNLFSRLAEECLDVLRHEVGLARG